MSAPLLGRAGADTQLLSACAHHVQDKATGVAATFFAKLQAALEEKALQELGDDMEEEALEKAKKSMAKKKMLEVKNAVRVTSSSMYGSVVWDSTYKRTDQEEKAWQET